MLQTYNEEIGTIEDIPNEITCAGCEIMVINGTITHEEGCPEGYKDLPDNDDDGDTEVVVCGWCGKGALRMDAFLSNESETGYYCDQCYAEED